MAATFDQHSEHYPPNQAFMSTGHTTWQEMPTTSESMSYPAISQQQHQFFAAPSYHQPDDPAEFSNRSAHWQQATDLHAAQPNVPFTNFAQDPAIKNEEPYNNQASGSVHHGLPASTAAEHSQSAAAATSPQSDNGWMSGSSSDHMEKPSKRGGLSFFIDNPPRLRPDGVRKKNARFEIPEDRKVDTIDRIILQTDPTDELLLKELKQQKRLLRNRQAALDSRCRKKEHTQKLEEERKILLSNMEAMEEELGHRRRQEHMWMHERTQWQAMVDRLNMEKEELVRQHTLEAGELRKKNNFLMEDAHRRTSLSMSAVPSSAGYSSTFSEFDHLSITESPTWEDFSLIHSHGEHEAPQQHNAAAVTAELVKKEDKSNAAGVLFMLLLCGAWVASKGASSTANMPQMPDEVRAASSAVLDNIYKDAGLQTSSSKFGDMTQPHAPAQSHHHNEASFDTAHPSFMSFCQLTTPSQHQQRDEAFSLTAAQYNAMTTDDSSYSTTPRSPVRPRRNLQDALASWRATKKGSASEAYTKSLLWDEVPTNMVRDFARMVAERDPEQMN